MNLTDLIPETAKFSLSSTGKEYEIRTPNLEDRVEMMRLVGGSEQNVVEVFTQKKWDQICKIVYRLMKDKSDFIAKRETFISDEGIKQEAMVTGPILLLRAIQTQLEAVQMLGALTAAMANGEPLVKEFIQNEVKKNLALQSTGESSSTSSPHSTDIPLGNSGNLPTAS